MDFGCVLQMRKLEDLLANRRIPGESHHHRRTDQSLHEELSATDPSLEEVSPASNSNTGPQTPDTQKPQRKLGEDMINSALLAPV